MTKTINMVQTPGEMEAIMIKTLQEKTGNTLGEWMEIIDQLEVEKKTSKIGSFLKNTFGVPHGTSYVLAQIYLNNKQPVYGNPQTLLNEQYKNKPELLNTYNQVIETITKHLGNNVKFGVCKGYVSLLAKKQFGVLLPKKNKICLGLSLPGISINNPFSEPTGNLKANEKITHQAEIETIDDLNHICLEMIKTAYQFYS